MNSRVLPIDRTDWEQVKAEIIEPHSLAVIPDHKAGTWSQRDRVIEEPAKL